MKIAFLILMGIVFIVVFIKACYREMMAPKSCGSCKRQYSELKYKTITRTSFAEPIESSRTDRTQRLGMCPFCENVLSVEHLHTRPHQWEQ